MGFASRFFYHLHMRSRRMNCEQQRPSRFAGGWLALAVLVALAGCAEPSAPASSPSPLPASSSYTPAMAPEAASGTPRAAAMALIQAERDAAIAGDLTTLQAIWTEDARIVDGRGTEDEADDYAWQGRDAVMDRYELAVLPAPPPPLEPGYLSALRVEALSDDVAAAEIGVDRWTLVRDDGRWRLAELRYN